MYELAVAALGVWIAAPLRIFLSLDPRWITAQGVNYATLPSTVFLFITAADRPWGAGGPWPRSEGRRGLHRVHGLRPRHNRVHDQVRVAEAKLNSIPLRRKWGSKPPTMWHRPKKPPR